MLSAAWHWLRSLLPAGITSAAGASGSTRRIGGGTQSTGAAPATLAGAPPHGDERDEPRPATRLAAHDEHLMERARVQWHFGDWASLAGIGHDMLRQHPDRARLALLVAAAHMQLRQTGHGRDFLRLAQEYGCSRKLIAQVMVSGVHNSLGRAALANGQRQRAFQHFEQAVTLGEPGGDARLLIPARAQEQFRQVHAFAGSTPAPAHVDPAQLGRAPTACPTLPDDLADDFLRPDRQAAAYASLTAACNELVTGVAMPPVRGTTVVHRDKAYHFAYFDGDHIGGILRDSGQFYESSFLNLLARLYQPGKIVVDGGANLGNHSVFFAAVLKARVVAFEPQPHNHFLLCANRRLNGLEEVMSVRRKALGSQPGEVTLHLAHASNFGTFSANAPVADTGRAAPLPGFAVEMTTLDEDMAAQRGDIGILKLDIEGMELDALLGAREILRHSRPLVAVECFNRSQYDTIKQFLADHDYFLIDAINATPTFIFVNRENAFQMKALADHLERTSLAKLGKNKQFNQP